MKKAFLIIRDILLIFGEDWINVIIRDRDYTSFKVPWKLVYVEELPTKTDALIREKNLKKTTKERIEAIILSNKNLLNYPII